MLDICLCELDIALCHLEVCVSEECLESEDVSAGSKELDREGVSKAVRVSVRDTCSVAYGCSDLQES